MIMNFDMVGTIGLLTLDHPPYNTLPHPVFADPEQLRAFFAAPGLKGVVVRGAGRHFCAGADPELVREQLADPDALQQALQAGQELLLQMVHAPVPIVAAIRGSCLGAGLELALACHFRFASRNALLGFPECSLGWMPGFGGTIRIQEVATRRTAIQWILSATMVRAEEAAAAGVIDRVTSTQEVEKEAISFLEALTANRSPNLVRAVMTAIHNGRCLPREEALQQECALFIQMARESCNPG